MMCVVLQDEQVAYSWVKMEEERRANHPLHSLVVASSQRDALQQIGIAPLTLEKEEERM